MIYVHRLQVKHAEYITCEGLPDFKYNLCSVKLECTEEVGWKGLCDIDLSTTYVAWGAFAECWRLLAMYTRRVKILCYCTEYNPEYNLCYVGRTQGRLAG